jgi:amino acid transporter
MMYAFARDGALPKFFDHVDGKYQSPTRAVWLAVFLAFLLAIPSLGSTVAFSAATSIATIGLYLSYGVPVLLLLVNNKRFVRGPFHLGKFSRPVGAVAVAWIGFITIVFCVGVALYYFLKNIFPLLFLSFFSLFIDNFYSFSIYTCSQLPTANPVTTQTLNYTAVAVGIVALYTFGSWYLWAHRWFKGPRLAALEEASLEPGAVLKGGDDVGGSTVGGLGMEEEKVKEGSAGSSGSHQEGVIHPVLTS